MIGLIFQNELILIKRIHQKSVELITVGIFQIKIFKYEPYIYNGCNDLMQKAMNFNDVADVSIKRSGYRIHLWNMSEDVTINIMINSNLNEKSGLLLIFLYYI